MLRMKLYMFRYIELDLEKNGLPVCELCEFGGHLLVHLIHYKLW